MSDNKSQPVKLSILANIMQQINSTASLPSLLETIMNLTKDIFNAESSSLLLMDDDEKSLFFYTATGTKGSEVADFTIPIGQGIVGTVAQTGKAILTNDAQQDPRFLKAIDELVDYETRNVICVPIKQRSKIIGVLEVLNSIGRDRFENRDLQLLYYIAEQAAVAIYNHQVTRKLQDRLDEITNLYKLTQSIAFLNNPKDLLNSFIDEILRTMSVTKCAVHLFNEREGKLELGASKGFEDVDDTSKDALLDTAKGIPSIVFHSKESLILKKITSDNRLHDFDLEKYEDISLVSVLLREMGTIQGVITCADKHDHSAFDDGDIQLLKTAASHLGKAYHNIYLQHEIIEKNRLDRELEIISIFQKSILPSTFPVKDQLDVTSYNQPSKLVSADFFDYYTFENKRIGIVVGDVSGKGIPATLYMTMVRNMLRTESITNQLPAQILKNANDGITNNSDAGMFVTVFLTLIDLHNNLLLYASAGHRDQILYRNEQDEFISLNASGQVLGIFPEVNIEEKATNFSSGDILILFTDGLVTATNSEGEEYRMDRLEEVIRSYADQNTEQIQEAILEDLLSFCPEPNKKDDLTFSVIKF